jgi:hypothetical protein
MDDAKQVFPERRNLDLRRLDRGRLDRGHMDAWRLDRGCMDARSSLPQKLVRLHNRPWASPTYQAAFWGQCVRSNGQVAEPKRRYIQIPAG